MTLPTSIDISDFLGVASIVLVAGASMWGVKKALRLAGV